MIRLPILVDGKVEMTEMPMLDVHSVVEYLFNTVGVQVPKYAIREFWNHSRSFNQPWAVNHEASDEHCPIGLYGDGAKFSTAFSSDKVVGLYMSFPLWRPTSIRASRYLLFSIEESKLHGPHTLIPVFQRISWSVNVLFHGRRPAQDPSGKPLANPHVFVMLATHVHLDQIPLIASTMISRVGCHMSTVTTSF